MANSIHPTQHERNEWSRMAQDAYRTARNFYGHRYSAFAAISRPLTVAEFDGLQLNYRLWLIRGWDAFLPEHAIAKAEGR